jgi:hypothetical protein
MIQQHSLLLSFRSSLLKQMWTLHRIGMEELSGWLWTRCLWPAQQPDLHNLITTTLFNNSLNYHLSGGFRNSSERTQQE